MRLPLVSRSAVVILNKTLSHLLQLVLTLSVCLLGCVATMAQTATGTSDIVPINSVKSIYLFGSVPAAHTINYKTAYDGSCGSCATPQNGSILYFNPGSGLVLYKPANNYTGMDSFQFQVGATPVAGGSETTSPIATVTITVTNALTTITDTLKAPNGTARTGKLSFCLTATATGPSGIIPKSACVPANLDSNGQFTVQLYPTASLSPAVYYQVMWSNTAGTVRDKIGLFEVPAATTTVTNFIKNYRVQDTAGNPVEQRYSFVDSASFQAYNNAVASLFIAAQASTLVVKTSDGATTVSGVTTINFSNGTVTNNGAGVVTINNSGSGSVGPGSTGAIAKFTGANAIGNSLLSESGAVLSMTGQFIIGATSAPAVGGGTQAKLFFDQDGGTTNNTLRVSLAGALYTPLVTRSLAVTTNNLSSNRVPVFSSFGQLIGGTIEDNTTVTIHATDAAVEGSFTAKQMDDSNLPTGENVKLYVSSPTAIPSGFSVTNQARLETTDNMSLLIKSASTRWPMYFQSGNFVPLRLYNNTVTVASGVTDTSGFTLYNLTSSSAPSASNAHLCVDAGGTLVRCVSDSGGGTVNFTGVTGTMTTGVLPKASGASTVVDSLISEASGVLTFGGTAANFARAITAARNLTVGGDTSAATTQDVLVLNRNNTGQTGDYLRVVAAASPLFRVRSTGDISIKGVNWTFPAAAGVGCLTSDAAGVLTIGACGGGGGGSGTLNAISEVDGTPSISNPTTLQIDQTQGLVLTNPSAGVARISLGTGSVPVNRLVAQTASKVAAFDGSGYLTASSVNTTDLQNATKIQSVNMAATAPTNGQVIKYNSTSLQWEPAADSGSGGSTMAVNAKSGSPSFATPSTLLIDNTTGGLAVVSNGGQPELFASAGLGIAVDANINVDENYTFAWGATQTHKVVTTAGAPVVAVTYSPKTLPTAGNYRASPSVVLSSAANNGSAVTSGFRFWTKALDINGTATLQVDWLDTGVWTNALSVNQSGGLTVAGTLTAGSSSTVLTSAAGKLLQGAIEQNGATSGQVLGWTGSTWAPQTVGGSISGLTSGQVVVATGSNTVTTYPSFVHVDAAGSTSFTKAQNGLTSVTVSNTNTGVNATAGFFAQSDAGRLDMYASSTTRGTAGLTTSRQGVLWAGTGLTSLLINTADSAVPVIVGVNGSERGRFTNLGFVVTSAVANSSGLYFTNINSSSPKVASSALLAVDGAGKVIVSTGLASVKVLDADFTKSANTTLNDIAGSSVNLTHNVDAGATYKFRAVLHVDADATGGLKWQLSGTATTTNIIYWHFGQGVSAGVVMGLRSTALNDPKDTNSVNTYYVTLEGSVTVNAAGTLALQFAQKTATGSSSVKRGSTFELIPQ
jgi:hypothetical protein